MTLSLEKTRRRGRKPLKVRSMSTVLNVRLTEAEHRTLEALGGSAWIRAQIALGGEPMRACCGRPQEYPGRPIRNKRFQCRLSTQERRRFHLLGGTAWLRRRIGDLEAPLINGVGS
jgi:hypothetical protein